MSVPLFLKGTSSSLGDPELMSLWLMGHLAAWTQKLLSDSLGPCSHILQCLQQPEKGH